LKLWQIGENRAAEYLDRKGYRILHRNFKCNLGEIDIIAMDGTTLCFIEVKTRTSLKHGLPCEAVTASKLEHIRRCATIYISRYRCECESIRIEIVEVLYSNDKYYVRHLKNIAM
jgi:putative endonuclease